MNKKYIMIAWTASNFVVCLLYLSGNLLVLFLMAHGITTNKDESGIYTRIANRLCREGYEVLRFDFRAHGESEGKQCEMTVSGEIMDLEASVEQLLNRGAKKVGIVVVPYGVALKYHKCNEESEFMTIKGADHGFGEENEGKVTNAIVNWLNKHLKRV